MTNEQIISKLKGYKGIIMYPTEEAEALKDAAIQALSQEPCDAVSRHAVLDYLQANVDDFPDYHEAIEKVLQMSSVTVRQTGEWIEELDDFGEVTNYHCSKCYEDTGFVTDCKWKFCPNCGADMRGAE